MRNFIPTNVARVVFAITMAFFGLRHLMSASQMAGMLAGWLMAEALNHISGICSIIAGISFVTHKKVNLAG